MFPVHHRYLIFLLCKNKHKIMITIFRLLSNNFSTYCCFLEVGSLTVKLRTKPGGNILNSCVQYAFQRLIKESPYSLFCWMWSECHIYKFLWLLFYYNFLNSTCHLVRANSQKHLKPNLKLKIFESSLLLLPLTNF